MGTTTLGATIASLRKDKGMTQLELAERMGVTDKAVSKWERGLSYPDVGSLPALAQILGVSVDELMQAGGQARREEPTGEGRRIFCLVLKAVSLAMGVGTVFLTALEQIDPSAGLSMLGIGLFCLALLQLQKGPS